MKCKEKVLYCKECGCELTSDNKSGYCERHKRKQAGNLKKAVGALLSSGGALLLIPKLFLRKK